MRHAWRDDEIASAPRVALVHDWLVGQRGGENVLLHMARLFAGAPIYTLVHVPGSVHPELEAHPIITSFIQRLPGAPRRFRHYLPLFPRAVGAFDLRAFDLVLSTSHCVAHGVVTAPHARHIAYVHTPMRYLYDQMEPYLPRWGRRLSAPLARLATAPLRAWDVRRAAAPKVFVANSAFVARRMQRVWGQQARVLYPPVDVDYFAAAPQRPRRGLLSVGALVPYKRADRAIALAQHLQLPLTVIGDGPQRAALQAMAGSNVTFCPSLSREALRAAYASAEALVFAGEEDFGIVPVEAMAAGCPVLARRTGGLAETVVAQGPEATGAVFAHATLPEMVAAWQTLCARRAGGGLDRATLVRQARRFDAQSFAEGLQRLLEPVDAAHAGPRGVCSAGRIH
jgi:glycosyltransferase involved in cell wall biosynthesis